VSVPRIAIVHEWFDTYAGSEKVVEQMLAVFPQAELFSVVDFLLPGQRGFLLGKQATTTFIQGLPFARKRFRSYLPLMPLAIEQLDLSAYDIVISSSHAVAKGVLTGPHQLHVSYVHSPIRYAWELQHQYLRGAKLVGGLKGWIARAMLHYLRQWDLRTVNGVDVFLANSHFIAQRIRKTYRREAQVIHPPVDVARFALSVEPRSAFYLCASRMVPYKRMPLVVEAFARMPQHRLVVIGDGPDLQQVRAIAPPNVSVLGFQSTEVLIDHMQRARALVFAAEEDFGITPVEAQACGTPVIAFGRGGSLETVRGSGPDRTGAYFHEQSIEAIVQAVEQFDAVAPTISAQACRDHAERFAPDKFRQAFKLSVDQAWADHRAREVTPPSTCALSL
jgi:glycosyltransferase involved in cell wall biosynthesis